MKDEAQTAQTTDEEPITTFKSGSTRYIINTVEYHLSNIPTNEDFLYNVARFICCSRRVQCIKYIRCVTGLGLRDTKTLMDMVTACGWSYKKELG